MDIDKLRLDTPGCHKIAHFNNAGAALMAKPVVDAILNYQEYELMTGGYEAANFRAGAIEDAYNSISLLLGTKRHNIALTYSATDAFNRAILSIPFQKGDIILTTSNDYYANQIVFMLMIERYGIELIRAENTTYGDVDLDSIKNAIDKHHPKLVAISHVPTNSGLVQPVSIIGTMCREKDILYLVDACQSVGQMPINPESIGCDFLTVTSRKYLRGPRGMGFLWVSDRVLKTNLVPITFGAEWTDIGTLSIKPYANRYEDYEVNVSNILGMGAAAKYATDLGLDNIANRLSYLTRFTKDTLADLPVLTNMDRGLRKCAIMTFAVAGMESGIPLRNALIEEGINTSISMRGMAVIDFDEKGLNWVWRISPHYYNTEEEIIKLRDTFLSLMAG
jgi:selenocysteine lyase/cysteine desulfurase